MLSTLKIILLTQKLTNSTDRIIHSSSVVMLACYFKSPNLRVA